MGSGCGVRAAGKCGGAGWGGAGEAPRCCKSSSSLASILVEVLIRIFVTCPAAKSRGTLLKFVRKRCPQTSGENPISSFVTCPDTTQRPNSWSANKTFPLLSAPPPRPPAPAPRSVSSSPFSSCPLPCSLASAVHIASASPCLRANMRPDLLTVAGSIRYPSCLTPDTRATARRGGRSVTESSTSKQRARAGACESEIVRAPPTHTPNRAPYPRQIARHTRARSQIHTRAAGDDDVAVWGLGLGFRVCGFGCRVRV